MAKFIPGGPPRYVHQKRGLNKMIRTGGVCALLFDPGTGKTATALDFCGVLAMKKAERGEETRVLVVAPLAAVDTWVLQARIWVSPQVSYWAEVLGGSLIERAEALAARGGQPFKPEWVEKRLLNGRSRRRAMVGPRAIHVNRSWAHDMERRDGRPASATQGPDGLGDQGARLVIEVVNIDTFSSRQQVGSGTMADLMLDAVKRYAPDLVIVDESHKIKSAMANSSRLLDRIGQVVSRRVILTGTVMPHGPLDVFGQWRFLEPHAFGMSDGAGGKKRATFAAFREQFAQVGGYMGKEIIGYKNLDDMQAVMARNAVVVRKKDALDLPPSTSVIVPVHLSATEQKAYDDMKANLAVQLSTSTSTTLGATATVGNRLTQMLRLRQITSGHLPNDQGGLHTLGQSKVNVIRSLVQDTLAGEPRIVVFCLFSKEIDDVCRVLSGEKGTEVLRIEGDTPSGERLAIRKRFGSDDPTRLVLVAQIKTISLAVNELVTANHAIFGSLSQQRDDLIQAQDRLDRIGQTRPVTFWYALAPNTVDEVIYTSHEHLTNLESAVLAHILGIGAPKDLDDAAQAVNDDADAAQIGPVAAE